MQRSKVLVINPGSTSTKVAVYEGSDELCSKSLAHSSKDIDSFERISDQFEFRKDIILDWLKDEGIATSELLAVVARGGLLRPMPAGIYEVSQPMIDDLNIGFQGQHASNLGGIIAKSIADSEGIKAYIVDPVAVDEFIDIARISGMPAIPRIGVGHALNVRAMAFKVAESLGKNFEDLNMIVAHLGGGISIIPIQKGRMIDNTNANTEGPFTPERAGGLPVGQFAKMCYSGDYTLKELNAMTKGKGGLVSYLGTNDVRKVTEMIEAGDKNAKLVLDAMCYQIGKQIAAVATSLKGNVDFIVLTGGAAYSKLVTDYISEMVSFIAPIKIEAGEDEMTALNSGFLRLKAGDDTAKIYEKEVHYD